MSKRCDHRVVASLSLAAALMACAMASAPARAATALTPEQAADLYLATFVNRDPASARRLNDYLKPAFGGRDAYDMDELRKFAQDKPKQDQAQAETLAAGLPAAQRATMTAALSNYFQAIDHAVGHAQCKATGSELEPNEVQRDVGGDAFKDAEIAEITFHCDIPDIAPGIGQEIAAALAAEAPADMLKATGKLKADVMRPRKRRTVDGSHRLYRSTRDEPWNGGAQEEWVAPILAALPAILPPPSGQ